jgi:predicted ThiF/HesA family dinucleotide-utilizing enzyme
MGFLSLARRAASDAFSAAGDSTFPVTATIQGAGSYDAATGTYTPSTTAAVGRGQWTRNVDQFRNAEGNFTSERAVLLYGVTVTPGDTVSINGGTWIVDQVMPHLFDNDAVVTLAAVTRG